MKTLQKIEFKSKAGREFELEAGYTDSKLNATLYCKNDDLFCEEDKEKWAGNRFFFESICGELFEISVFACWEKGLVGKWEVSIREFLPVLISQKYVTAAN